MSVQCARPFGRARDARSSVGHPRARVRLGSPCAGNLRSRFVPRRHAAVSDRTFLTAAAVIESRVTAASARTIPWRPYRAIAVEAPSTNLVQFVSVRTSRRRAAWIAARPGTGAGRAPNPRTVAGPHPGGRPDRSDVVLGLPDAAVAGAAH